MEKVMGNVQKSSSTKKKKLALEIKWLPIQNFVYLYTNLGLCVKEYDYALKFLEIISCLPPETYKIGKYNLHNGGTTAQKTWIAPSVDQKRQPANLVW